MSKKVLVFGLAFFMMGLIVFYGLWNSATVTMNGREISQAEYRESGAVFFPLLFILVGAGAAGWGGFMVFKERETEKYGWECYGLVTDIRSTHFKFNHVEQLKAVVKIDVTPKSVYDRFAQEQTIENLLMNGFFTAQRVSELATYAEVLDDDSVAPKMKILEAIDHIKGEQRKIAMIEAQAQAMQQKANQFLMGDPGEQSSMMADAQRQIMAQQEAQFAQQESALDAQVETK